MLCADDDLSLYIVLSGAKYWRMRCRQGKKETKLALGEYPIVSLAEARDMCTDVKRGMVHIKRGHMVKNTCNRCST